MKRAVTSPSPASSILRGGTAFSSHTSHCLTLQKVQSYSKTALCYTLYLRTKDEVLIEVGNCSPACRVEELNSRARIRSDGKLVNDSNSKDFTVTV